MFTKEQLRFELGRRKLFPADSERLGITVPQVVTVADLEAELAAMPADATDRGWCEWELALAREHYHLTPDDPFVRQVVAPRIEGAQS
jgi:hypothetical protein